MARNSLNTVKVRKPRTNQFDLSHDVKMSGQMGKLMPVLAMECIPGDYISLSNEIMLRFAPLIAPVMHRVDVSVHYWFVPNRILWPNFEDFITGGERGDASPAWPYVEMSDVNTFPSSLADYLGIPVIETTEPETFRNVSALPFAAYTAIWSEWYRDQNLIDEPDWELDDGDNTNKLIGETGIGAMRYRSWQHDYFTAALPFAQKGADVLLPIGSFEDVAVYTAPHPSVPSAMTVTQMRTSDGLPISNTGLTSLDADWQSGDIIAGLSSEPDGGGTSRGLSINAEDSGFLARTSELQAEAATINNLRLAFRLQEWEELNARGGGRFAEVLQAHFGVRPQDYRLQRPEYIGGSKQPVTISEVLNTVGTAERPQGDMAGHGLSVGASGRSKYYCHEHGYIIGVMSVMPKPAYQQGIPRHFLKSDKYMYYWPTFAHLGEQEVMNQELYVNHEEPEDTFGYLPRYQEYRGLLPRVAGDFKTSLNFWHLGRIFENAPALNQEFIEVKPEDVNRIFAVQDNSDNLWMHIYHKIRARRPIPKFGTPSF